MLKQFRKNKSYLVISELQHLLLMSSAIAILSFWNPWNYQSIPMLILLCVPLIFSGPLGYLVTGALVYKYFSPPFLQESTAFLVLGGFFYGLVHSQVVHFCAHWLLRPRWLNRLLGEILSMQFFGTFLGFTIVHLEHHAHADDLSLDPHPNQAEGFFNYAIRLHGTMALNFKRLYFNLHGTTQDTERLWKTYLFLRPTRLFSRVIVLLLALGPKGFLFFLLPSMLLNHWVFGHLNYYSHIRKPDGTVDIQNLNQKTLHKVLNFFTLGAYHHADHHRSPNSFFSPNHEQ
ncbi:MAG: fatty acid desaturase [Proteobacteria bacterium]|jgi:fatty acid desaturase|nr:fatty acid desaturase [Pseudomonadota bacterium]